jgi:hypothetical protein
MNAHEAKGNTKEAKRIRGIQWAEEVKQQAFKPCAPARQLYQEGGISYLMVPVNPDDSPAKSTEWKHVDDPQTIQ